MGEGVGVTSLWPMEANMGSYWGVASLRLPSPPLGAEKCKNVLIFNVTNVLKFERF